MVFINLGNFQTAIANERSSYDKKLELPKTYNPNTKFTGARNSDIGYYIEENRVYSQYKSQMQ